MESKVSLKERIIAIFVVILVITSLVAFSFAVPWTKVHAESVADQWEDYIDNMMGEGSSYLLESALEKAGGPAMIGVMYGLNIIETYSSGAVPVNTIATREGWCYNQADGKKYLVNTTIASGQYHSADGGFTICESGFFKVSAAWVGTENHYFQNYVSNGGWCGSIYYPGPVQDFSCDITSNFVNGNFTSDFNDTSSYKELCWRFGDSSTSIPTVSLNDPITDYFGIYYSGWSPDRIASEFNGDTINWGTYMDSIGIDPTTTIDPSNIFDFIVNIYNPAIEEEYPDLTVYLFYPEEPTTDTDSSGGCNCHVYVYVTEYFDPEINVYVTEYITVTNNVEIELPSEWVQDYTFETDPTELPLPELPTDPLTTEPVTYPSIDESEMQEYEEEFGDGIRFWLWLTGEFVEKLGLQTICGFVFVVAVAGFVLWKAGGSGGGKND